MSNGTDASMTPLMPPITNIDRKPSANSMAAVKWILPPQSVPSQLNTLMPVGTAMIIEVIMNGIRSSGVRLVNMWCAQTVKPTSAIAIDDSAMAR